MLESAPECLVLLTDGPRWVRLTEPVRPLLLRGAPAGWHDLDVAVWTPVGSIPRWEASGTVFLRHSVASAVATARGVAVLVRPTPAAGVLDLAALGVLMPWKSTLFVPGEQTIIVDPTARIRTGNGWPPVP